MFSKVIETDVQLGNKFNIFRVEDGFKNFRIMFFKKL